MLYFSEVHLSNVGERHLHHSPSEALLAALFIDWVFCTKIILLDNQKVFPQGLPLAYNQTCAKAAAAANRTNQPPNTRPFIGPSLQMALQISARGGAGRTILDVSPGG